MLVAEPKMVIAQQAAHSMSNFPSRRHPLTMSPGIQSTRLQVSLFQHEEVERPRSILVVEDDQDIRATVADILEFEGYQVEQARDGAEGLRVLEQSLPALILLDMRMPVMNGWEFAAELKKRGIQAPVVVMTAAQDARRWAEDINAQGFVAKPFHLPDLLAVVEGLLPGSGGQA